MFRATTEFCARTGLDALHRFDLRELIERFIPRAFGVEYDYVSQSELKGRLALFDPNTMVLKIREDLSRLITLETPEARFTVLHELIHIVFHRRPLLARSVGRGHDRYEDSEIQADFMAVAICTSLEQIERFDTAEKLSSFLSLPRKHCEAFFDELRRDGVIEDRKKNGIELQLDAVQERLFDEAD